MFARCFRWPLVAIPFFLMAPILLAGCGPSARQPGPIPWTTIAFYALLAWIIYSLGRRAWRLWGNQLLGQPPAKPMARRGEMILFQEMVTQNFSIAEVRALAHAQDLDYTRIRGSSHGEKIENLIIAAHKRGKLRELWSQVEGMRPDLAWPEFKEDSP